MGNPRYPLLPKTEWFGTQAEAESAGTLLNHKLAGGDMFGELEVREVVRCTNGEYLVLEVDPHDLKGSSIHLLKITSSIWRG